MSPSRGCCWTRTLWRRGRRKFRVDDLESQKNKGPVPFTTPRASPTTWLLGGQRGTLLGLHLDICTTVPILWFLPYWSLGDTKALGEPKPMSWPRRAKPSPSLGTPENLSESEMSWRVQPPLCGVNGIVLTSKTCVPVAVGVHANAEGARSLGPGLAPHAVLEGQSHLSPCPGLGLRQLWAEKPKQCPGRGLTGHSCPLPTPWKRGQGSLELVQCPHPQPYRGVGEDEAIWVGDNLQEDVHLVQDGGQTFIFLLILDNLQRVEVWGLRAHRHLHGDGHAVAGERGKGRTLWPFGDMRCGQEVPVPSWQTRHHWLVSPTRGNGCRCRSRWPGGSCPLC